MNSFSEILLLFNGVVGKTVGNVVGGLVGEIVGFKVLYNVYNSSEFILIIKNAKWSFDYRHWPHIGEIFFHYIES